MALAYNDDLKAAQKNIEAGIELERAARADRMPSLGAGANFRYTGNPYEYTAELPNVGELSFQGRHVKYGASASLMQPVYTGGRILEAIRLAQSQRLVAEAQQDLLHAAVCYQTDVLYWTAVARFELLGVAREFRNAVADLARIVGERVEEGMCDRQELLTVEVKLNEAEYQLLQAQSVCSSPSCTGRKGSLFSSSSGRRSSSPLTNASTRFFAVSRRARRPPMRMSNTSKPKMRLSSFQRASRPSR